jgi:hypothetical protein
MTRQGCLAPWLRVQEPNIDCEGERDVAALETIIPVSLISTIAVSERQHLTYYCGYRYTENTLRHSTQFKLYSYFRSTLHRAR